MDVANQVGGLVLGTGDLSELALGWATYNGDHMSMYAVNASIPKTLVKHLVRWVADHIIDESCYDVLLDIVDTPISPELLPANEQGEISQKRRISWDLTSFTTSSCIILCAMASVQARFSI